MDLHGTCQRLHDENKASRERECRSLSSVQGVGSDSTAGPHASELPVEAVEHDWHPPCPASRFEIIISFVSPTECLSGCLAEVPQNLTVSPTRIAREKPGEILVLLCALT